MSEARVLVCGGAGYIGSHMVRMLAENGFNPLVLDNLSTGHKEAVVKALGLEEKAGKLSNYLQKLDLKNRQDLKELFSNFEISAVMHFAAKSLVGESMTSPAEYYENNLVGALNLLEAMRGAGIKHIVFSSTAAVYGQPEKNGALKESDRLQPINPYGRTKLAMEWALRDYFEAYGISSASLRYFNAAGAHEKGDLGEAHDPETHLIPNVLKALINNKAMQVNGDDYDSPDGTCVRDYIHVEDLCRAHISALKYITDNKGASVFNLGSSTGYSIREIIKESEEISGKKLNYEIGPRRKGDPAVLIANADKAGKELGWSAKKGLHDILKSAWIWHNKKCS